MFVGRYWYTRPARLPGYCCNQTDWFLMAGGIVAVLRSWRSFLWIVPLMLRFFSSACALHRKPLISPSSSAVNDPLQDFEIHCPSLTGSLMLIIAHQRRFCNSSDNMDIQCEIVRGSFYCTDSDDHSLWFSVSRCQLACYVPLCGCQSLSIFKMI